MAINCPVDLDLARLRAEVQSMYTRVAADPTGDFHFHRGPAYAAERLGYDASELARLPDSATGSFAGIGNPHLVQPLAPGATVLDMGCGAGTDLLLAAMHVGSTGRAIGVDMTEPMVARARAGAESLGLSNVEVKLGDATSLPVDDQSIEVLISNGVFNLVPDKERALGEIFRVVRRRGRLQLADIVLGSELDEAARRDVDLWTGWIAGALPEAEICGAFESVGFINVRITHRFDPFGGTKKERTARKYGVIGVNIVATRP